MCVCVVSVGCSAWLGISWLIIYCVGTSFVFVTVHTVAVVDSICVSVAIAATVAVVVVAIAAVSVAAILLICFI